MAKSAAATTRAPRGTKIVAQAFFSAADEIPEARRAEVVRAALALIREQLKDARGKAKSARGKPAGAKGPATRMATRKSAGVPLQARLLPPKRQRRRQGEADVSPRRHRLMRRRRRQAG